MKQYTMNDEFFAEKETKSGILTIAVKPMTREQAREAYPYRPASKYSESRFGGNTLYDDICLLLNGLAARCRMCQAPTKNQYLVEGMCPDCNGRSQANGTNPHEKAPGA
jgi:hypothetical protein